MAKKKRQYTMTDEARAERSAKAKAAAEARWAEGKPGNPVKALSPLVEVEGVGMLHAMRFVLVNGFHHDRVQQNVSMIRAARKWLRDDPMGFDRKLTELESGAAPRQVENRVEDLGEKAALRLLDKLLASYPGNTDVGTESRDGGSGEGRVAEVCSSVGA